MAATDEQAETPRCDAVPLGLFGPARCPQDADVRVLGVCAAGHPSHLMLCNADAAVLTNGGRQAIGGPCLGPGPLPSVSCGRYVALRTVVRLHG